MGYETPYPEPRAPHPEPLTKIAELSNKTTRGIKINNLLPNNMIINIYIFFKVCKNWICG